MGMMRGVSAEVFGEVGFFLRMLVGAGAGAVVFFVCLVHFLGSPRACVVFVLFLAFLLLRCCCGVLALESTFSLTCLASWDWIGLVPGFLGLSFWNWIIFLQWE